MTITAVGSRDVRFDTVSSTSWTINTNTASTIIGNYLFVCLSFINLGAADGDNSEVTGIADDGSNTWRKFGEYTNSGGGVGLGLTVSTWMTKVTTQIDFNSTDIVVSFSGAVTEKAASFFEFSATADLIIGTGYTNPVVNEVNAAVGFGSAAFSSLSSKGRLYFRVLGKQANTIANLTASTNFTAIDSARSQAAATARTIYGEFRINNSTGETSNPTLAVSGNTAGLFISVEEQGAANSIVWRRSFSGRSSRGVF